MAFEVKIIADSIAANGRRLTTITATYPRIIHAEVMTHRDRARNAASSRAIPWEKMRAAILDDPFVPIEFGAEKRGMQTGEALQGSPAEWSRHTWLMALEDAVLRADILHSQGVHKSLVNRLVEPFSWITVVMTATEWANFFRLRCHPDAEVHFQKIAGMIRDSINRSEPQKLEAGQWHMPFVVGNDFPDLAKRYSFHEILRISVARCARVSYLSHEGKRDPDKDLCLFDRLVQGSGFGHWSAHEHVACAEVDPEFRSGPFVGWRQFRKEFATENLAG